MVAAQGDDYADPQRWPGCAGLVRGLATFESGRLMADDAVSLYLDLLKRCVSNLIYQDPAVPYVGEKAEGPVTPVLARATSRGQGLA